jgi:phospholipid transport system substrate-binding protein
MTIPVTVRWGLVKHALLACLILLAGQVYAADEASPVAVIDKTALALGEALSGKQDYYADHPAGLYALIDQILLPSFDIEYTAKQVLGRTHWTAASETQRRRFIATFSDFLVKTYAKAILEFDQDRLTVLPKPSYSKDGGKALVRTQLVLNEGDSVLINYALRKIPEGWRIYDMRVDGVSYVQNYRSQFDAEITANGIESVIQRLEVDAAAADTANKVVEES